MSRPYLRCFVLIYVLIGGAVAPFAAPAAAQAGANNTSSNASAISTSPSSGSSPGGALVGSNVSSLRPSQAQVNRSGNATNATNGSSGNGGGGGGLVGGVTGAAKGAWNSATPDVPTTEEIANDTANWTEQHLLNASVGLLDNSIGFVVGTSHPVNSGTAGVFGTPTNQPYENLYQTIYGPITFQYSVLMLVLLLLAMVIVMPYAGLASGGSYRAVQMCARIIAALVFIMFWWPIGTALTQFFDAITVAIAPSAQELTSSMQGLFKLSLGPILATIAIYVVGLSQVLGLAFVYAFRQAALIVFQFAMPLVLIFAYVGPHRRIRSMASTVAWQYFALLTMTIPTAFLMRIGYEAEWGFGFGAVGNVFISMMLLALALATPFVFSIAAFRAPPSIQSIASGAAGAAMVGGSAAREKQPWFGGEEEEEQENAAPEATPVGESGGTTYNIFSLNSPQERVAATDGGTNYIGATARGPGPQPDGALGSGSNGSGTAEWIRDFEKESRGSTGGSAAQQTQYYDNQRDVIGVESTSSTRRIADES